MNINDLTENYNKAKEIFVEYLQNNKLCTEDQAKEFKEELAFVLVEKGMFGKTLDTVLGFKKDDEAPRIKLMKILK